MNNTNVQKYIEGLSSEPPDGYDSLESAAYDAAQEGFSATLERLRKAARPNCQYCDGTGVASVYTTQFVAPCVCVGKDDE